MWHDNPEWLFFLHGWGMLFWLLILVFLIWLVIRLFFRGTLAGPTESNAALKLLDERFARGEIDEAEYQRRKAALKAGSQ